MKKRKTGAALLALSLLVTVPGLSAGPSPGRGADIRKTVDAVLRTDAPDGSVQKGLVTLVEIAGAIGRDARLAEPARSRLEAAVAKTSTATLLSPEAAKVLGDAYGALNGGKPFAFPPEVRSLDGARALVRSLGDRSAKALEAGRPAEAARDLLGAVLAVVTPMEARP